MAKQQIRVELLLGEKVFALNGRAVGRLEEIRTNIDRGQCFVSEFLVGGFAMLERLSAWGIGRAVLDVLRLRRDGYRIRWDQLDLSDPQRLRLLCEVDELLPLRKGQFPS